MHKLIFVHLAFVLGALIAHGQMSQGDLSALISRYKNARADATAYLDTRSIHCKGMIQQNGQQYKYELTQRESGQIRYEINRAGQTIIQVFDGQVGWLWVAGNPELGAHRLNAKQLRFFRLNSSFLSPLDDPRHYGFELSYAGLELSEAGKPQHHLRMTSRSWGDEIDVWIDAFTFLEVRRDYRPESGAEPLTTTFSDYRKVEGIMTPHLVVTTFQGEELSRATVEHTSRNSGLLSFFFTKPNTYAEVTETQDGDS